MRRAAVSVPANIAEELKRLGKADKVRFLNIAGSSLEETRYFLILTEGLGYAPTRDAMEVLENVSRLLRPTIKLSEILSS